LTKKRTDANEEEEKRDGDAMVEILTAGVPLFQQP